MRIKTDDAPTEAFLVDGLIYEQQNSGGLLLYVDQDGNACTITDRLGRRLATAADILDLVSSGRAAPIRLEGGRSDTPLRRLRAPTPWVDAKAGRRSAGTYDTRPCADAAREADDALTLGAFVHLSDPNTDVLAGYEVYLRTMARLCRRHRGVALTTVNPTAFRRRVAEVGTALAAAGQADVLTVH